jgi:hypothetical protein
MTMTRPRSWLLGCGVALAAVVASCGSGSTSPGRSREPTPARAQQDALSFSRCMRSHGVSNFPDPTATGGLNLDVPGINPSSPSFESAQAACRRLLPVKRPALGPPSAQAHARLLRLAQCMRARGYSGLPDPRPAPPPPNASFGTAFGLGAYYIAIPNYMKPHSPAFIRALESCHESP